MSDLPETSRKLRPVDRTMEVTKRDESRIIGAMLKIHRRHWFDRMLFRERAETVLLLFAETVEPGTKKY